MNTCGFLSTRVALRPTQEILVCDQVRLTYDKLNERVNRLANGLRSLGFGKGSHIGILQANSLQYIETYYAVSKLGGVFVPLYDQLNYRARPDEPEYLINTARVEALLVGEGFIDLAFSLRENLPTVKIWIGLEKRHPGMVYYEDLISGGSVDDVEEELDGEETNVLIFTRGTTSLPKPVMLSYGTLYQYAQDASKSGCSKCGDPTLFSTPLSHVVGITTVISSVSSGRRLVLMRRFYPEEWLRLVKLERIASAFLMPAMLRKLLDEPSFGRADLSSLKTISYGMSPMQLSIIKQVIERFPKRIDIVCLFGQTETITPVTALLPEDHRLDGTEEEVKAKLQRLRSVGRALPNAEIKIVDHEEQEVASGDIGEIIVRNSKTMKGYFDHEGLTRKVLVDGWLRTSILAWQDEDGYVFHVGRKDNLVISNEGDISSDDVDSLLLYPQAPRYEGHRIRVAAGDALPPAKLELQNVIQLDCFLAFLNTVSEAQDAHTLRENYLAAIPQIVTASAYGFMLLETQGSLSRFPPFQSQLRDSSGREDEAWLAHEPISLNIVWRWHPSRESQVFWDGGRHSRDCQHLNEAHELMRFVRVPIGAPGGRLVGALSFARAACQPPFDKRDLELIRLVAQQMFQPVSHALKHDEMKEKFASAEGALEAMSTAVIVTDEEGRVKFANNRARKLMEQAEFGPSVVNAVRNGVQDNLSEIGTLGKRVATADVRLPGRAGPGRSNLVLRSVRIPSSSGSVATFLYAQEEIPSFQYLLSILSKREIEVLELLAQGFQNREIADILVVTPHTVKYHLNQMFRKMQVNSRSELLAKAFSSSPHS